VKEQRWLAARVTDGGRIVRLVYGNGSSHGPVEVRVRMEDAEVGLALRVQDPETYLMDVRLHCAEVELSEAVGERRLSTTDRAPPLTAWRIRSPSGCSRRARCRASESPLSPTDA
jgi:hypothetical protein